MSVFDSEAQRRYAQVIAEWDLAIRRIRDLNARLDESLGEAGEQVPEKVKVVRLRDREPRRDARPRRMTAPPPA